ncbi:hypothetical protein [Microbacterium sp. SD291]|uniref:hypothetical protein n=1 Tax=Microbacterium sp. SD291 TaxID=2782007 RepID=UPI001A9791F3|nr:hypothetical protein [Microbacterium sp. SD291]MBO0980999.1 hypothetical protein [Microbacterium sp. SD291]
MRRMLRLGAPSSAAVLLRLTQFVVLACLGHLSSGPTQAALISSFGVVSAFGVLADSGAANYLLGSSPEHLSRQRLIPVVRLHGMIALAGATAAVIYCAAVFAEPLGDGVLIVVVLAAAQALDSLIRAVRAPLLVHGLDHEFAGSDFLLAGAKVVVAIISLAVGSLIPLCALPVASLVIGTIFWRRIWRMLPVGERERGTARRVLSFGIAGASSALYSQSPLLIGGVLLPVEAVAALSLASRIVQPTEIVPATLAQQAIPRLRAGVIGVVPLALGLGGLGLLAGGALWLLRPLVEVLLGVAFEPVMVLAVILLALPLKFADYALTSGLYSRGMVRAKLIVSLMVGAIVIAATVAAASTGGVVAVASVWILAEALLLLGLGGALMLTRKQKEDLCGS